MTAYESFLNLNPRHSWLMRQTNKKMHFEECGMDTEDLEDVKLDICDQVNLLVERREQGRLQDARAVACRDVAATMPLSHPSLPRAALARSTRSFDAAPPPRARAARVSGALHRAAERGSVLPPPHQKRLPGRASRLQIGVQVTQQVEIALRVGLPAALEAATVRVQLPAPRREAEGPEDYAQGPPLGRAGGQHHAGSGGGARSGGRGPRRANRGELRHHRESGDVEAHGATTSGHHHRSSGSAHPRTTDAGRAPPLRAQAKRALTSLIWDPICAWGTGP